MRLSLDSQTELEPIDEQPNLNLMHLDGSVNFQAKDAGPENPLPLIVSLCHR